VPDLVAPPAADAPIDPEPPPDSATALGPSVDSLRARIAARLDGSGVDASRLTFGGRLTVGRVVAAVAVAAAAFVGVRLFSTPAAPPEASLPMVTSTVASDTGTPPGRSASSSTTAGAEVVVDAAGAIVRPGVYRLPGGSRVADLVAAAGGFAPDAEGDRVNLAALLEDGEEVYVPRVGEAVPPPPAGGSTSSGAADQESRGGPSPDHPLDLNTATVADLDLLPGIGPTTAQAIVDYRAEHGAFRTVDDLLDVRGIGDAKLADIRSLVRV
jgi:competence protein ComEA